MDSCLSFLSLSLLSLFPRSKDKIYLPPLFKISYCILIRPILLCYRNLMIKRWICQVLFFLPFTYSPSIFTSRSITYNSMQSVKKKKKWNETAIQLRRIISVRGNVVILYLFRYVHLMRSPCPINKAEKQIGATFSALTNSVAKTRIAMCKLHAHTYVNFRRNSPLIYSNARLYPIIPSRPTRHVIANYRRDFVRVISATNYGSSQNRFACTRLYGRPIKRA